MSLFSVVIQGLTIGFSAVVSPGPLQAFFLSQTLRNGWKRTLPTALAPLFSDGPIILLVVLILTQTPVWFLTGLQFIGGLFLLYLAWGVYRASQIEQAAGESSDSRFKSLTHAVLTNLLNPLPYIFWGSVGGPILLSAWRVAPTLAVSFLSAFYVTLIGGFAALILLFGMSLNLGNRVVRLLNGAAVLALLLFGLYRVWAAFQPTS